MKKEPVLITYVDSRPLNSRASILFELDTITSSTSATIALTGSASNTLAPAGYTSTRAFGIMIVQNYVYPYAKGDVLNPYPITWIATRPYVLTLEFVRDVGVATLTTPEDPDFQISFEVGGFGDMVNPRLYVQSMQVTSINIDLYEIYPKRETSSFEGTANKIYEDKTVASIKVSGAGGTGDSTSDRINGRQALTAESTSNPDWLTASTTIVDSNDRYLVFWAKVPSTTGQFRIWLKVFQGTSLNTYYVEPKDISASTSLWDFVMKRDNQWHPYVVNLYETFGIRYGAIKQFSVQRDTGTVLVDSIYLVSSISAAEALISSSKLTSEELDPYVDSLGDVFAPDAYYQFENNLDDSGANSFGGTFNSQGSWTEDFNDNSISSVWTLANHANMQMREQNQRLEGYQTTGGSGWQSATLTKSTTYSGLLQAEIDAEYYFPAWAIST